MANGKEISSAMVIVIRSLVVAGILGLASMAGVQLVLSSRMATAEETLAKNQPTIDSIDVVKVKVVNLEKDLEKLDKKMDKQHQAVMAAIQASR